MKTAEHSNALGGRDVIGRAFLRYFGNEVHNRCFGRAIVPRRNACTRIFSEQFVSIENKERSVTVTVTALNGIIGQDTHDS